LAISGIAVDNNKGGGFERRQGNAAVVLAGQTIHYLPKNLSSKADTSRGIGYFIFDAWAQDAHAEYTIASRQLANHVEEQNLKAATKRKRPQLQERYKQARIDSASHSRAARQQEDDSDSSDGKLTTAFS
jgi:uncharacterized protein (DUF2252 family)